MPKEQICGRKTVRSQSKGWMIYELIHNKYMEKTIDHNSETFIISTWRFFPLKSGTQICDVLN